MRGRKPKPTGLRLIEGNREHRTIHAELEPKPAAVKPPCPKILTGQARKHWRYLVKQLEAMSILGQSDQGTIMSAAIAFGQAYDLQEQVKGITDKKKKTPEDIKSQMGILRALRQTLRDLVTFEAHLGLNPTARTRIKLEKPQTQSRLERLLS